MKNQGIQIFIIILVTAAATFFVTKTFIPPEKSEVVRIDTLMVKADTVFKDRSVAIHLQGKIDTVIVNDTIRSIVAKADTLIRKDSSYIKVSYFFPPENYFDIQFDIKEKIVTITREIMKYIEIPQPWYDHFWTGAAAVLTAFVSIVLLIRGL